MIVKFSYVQYNILLTVWLYGCVRRLVWAFIASAAYLTLLTYLRNVEEWITGAYRNPNPWCLSSWLCSRISFSVAFRPRQDGNRLPSLSASFIDARRSAFVSVITLGALCLCGGLHQTPQPAATCCVVELNCVFCPNWAKERKIQHRWVQLHKFWCVETRATETARPSKTSYGSGNRLMTKSMRSLFCLKIPQPLSLAP